MWVTRQDPNYDYAWVEWDWSVSIAFFYLEDVIEAASGVPEAIWLQEQWGEQLDDYDRHILGYDSWLRGCLVSSELAICREQGHDIEDCSSGGPESGNMDHECKRCGEYWHVPLY